MNLNTGNIRHPYLAMAMFAIAASTAMAAHADTIDLGALSNGVTYDVPANIDGGVSATFTVEEDGLVQVQCTGDVLFAYSTPEHETENMLDYKNSYINGKPTLTYSNCKAGEVLYFYQSFVFSGGTVTVTNGDIPLKVETVTPSPDPTSPTYYGGVFSASGDTRVTLSFNLNVSVGSAKLSVNGIEANLTPSYAGNICEVNPGATLIQMYKNGTLTGGETMDIIFSGIHAAGDDAKILAPDGTVTLSYVMGDCPVWLVSSVNTPDSGMADFLSYYLPDNPSARVEFTFSGNVSSEGSLAPYGELSYGDPDDIDAGMYYETLTPVVEGNTLAFDFAGVRRRPVDMVPLLAEDKRPSLINFVVRNVHGEDGQPMYTGSESNPFSFGYNYNLVTLQYNIASDFTPNASASIESGSNLEIYVMDGVYLHYEGVKFSYKSEGDDAELTVPADKLTVAPDDFNPQADIVINLTVPELTGIDAGSPVTVTLADMVCADGLDHSADVECIYGGYTVGVDGISVAEIKDAIFTIDGISISHPASQLPKGVYVTGGRKVIVK